MHVWNAALTNQISGAERTVLERHAVRTVLCLSCPVANPHRSSAGVQRHSIRRYDPEGRALISQLIPLPKHETLICTTSLIEKRTAPNEIEAREREPPYRRGTEQARASQSASGWD